MRFCAQHRCDVFSRLKISLLAKVNFQVTRSFGSKQNTLDRLSRESILCAIGFQSGARKTRALGCVRKLSVDLDEGSSGRMKTRVREKFQTEVIFVSRVRAMSGISQNLRQTNFASNNPTSLPSTSGLLGASFDVVSRPVDSPGLCREAERLRPE